MYIQPNWAREETPLQIPENYSGTAMDPHSPIHTTVPERGAEPAPAISEAESAAERRVLSGEQDDTSGSDAARPAGRAGDAYAAEPPPAPPGEAERDTASEDPSTAEAPRGEPGEPEGQSAPTGETQSVFRNIAPPHRGEGLHLGGFLSRFPFLHSLLPPKHQKGAPGSDLALVVGIFLLLSDNKEDDILPLLLILLLA